MLQFNSSDDYSLWADSTETVHGQTKKACSFNALHKKYLQTYNKINQSINQLINLSLFLSFFLCPLSSFVSQSKGVKQHKTFLLCKTLCLRAELIHTHSSCPRKETFHNLLTFFFKEEQLHSCYIKITLLSMAIPKIDQRSCLMPHQKKNIYTCT